MAIFNKNKASAQEIRTFSAGNPTLGISPNIYEWAELPSRIVLNGIVPLNYIQIDLENQMVGANLPVVFTKGRIEYRETFSKRYEDCIIISHKDPPTSYFDFLLTCRATNDSTFVRIYRAGFSYYNYKINEYKDSKKETDGFMRTLNFLHYTLDKPDLQAWEDELYMENQYYAQIIKAIKEFFDI